MSSNTNDDELRARLLAWAHRSLSIISANLDDYLQVIAGLESWHCDSQDTFVQVPFLPTYRFGTFDEALLKGPEWDALVHACDTHINFSKHVGQLVGSSYSGSNSWDLASLCKSILPVPSVDGDRIVLDPRFDLVETVDALIREVNRDDISITTVWPICGVRTDVELPLDGNTAFRPLTVSEKISCLRGRSILPMHPSRVEPAEAAWCGLVLTERLPKEFGGCTTVPLDLMDWLGKKVTVLEDFLVLVPMLGEHFAFHAGGYHAAPRLETQGSLARGVTTYSSSGASIRFLHPDLNKVLSAEEHVSAKRLWQLLRKVQSDQIRRRVINAMRRYYYAETRHTIEDKLVDYMIAAESLYLDDDKNELRFRLSLNAATWNDGASMPKEDIFNLFKKAYDLRSKVVHGSHIDAPAVAPIVEEVKQVLHSGIVKALGGVNNGEYPPNWTQLLLT